MATKQIGGELYQSALEMLGPIDMAGLVFENIGYSIISPTAIAAQANDYAPTGFAAADVVRLTLTGNQTLTGMLALTAATGSIVKRILNIDTADTLTISHNSGSSSVGNKFACPGSVDATLSPNSCAVVFYDVTSAVWRIL